MGLAASQARLICLNARMSDVEYQAQQINQERLLLSNQTNTLYNQLLELEVPTPPSSNDYTIVQYSGIDKATNFTLGAITPSGKSSTGNDLYTIDFQYERAGKTVSKNNNSAILKRTSPYLGFEEADPSKYIDNTPTTRYTKDTENPITTAFDPEDYDPEQNVIIETTVGAYNDVISSGSALSCEVYDENGNDIKDNLPSDPNTTIYVKCNACDIVCGYTAGNGTSLVKCDEDGYTNVYGVTETTEPTGGIREGLTDADVQAMNLYYVTGGSDDSEQEAIAITTVADLQTALDNNYGIYVRSDDPDPEIKFLNPQYDNTKGNGDDQLSVGDMPVMLLADAEAQLGESYADYLEALRHAFPEYSNIKDDTELAKLFYVYISTSDGGTQVPHFIKSDEMGVFTDEQSIRTYEYDADGTYTHTEPEYKCQLEFDINTGRITQVGIPNNDGSVRWVEVKAETVKDEDAYNDAMNDYEYEKLLYDKKQQEINAKTSVIQQQDKNLELKLTRLDNERESLNTEIEAVQKVIDDAIEGGFKTFG